MLSGVGGPIRHSKGEPCTTSPCGRIPPGIANDDARDIQDLARLSSMLKLDPGPFLGSRSYVRSLVTRKAMVAPTRAGTTRAAWAVVSARNTTGTRSVLWVAPAKDEAPTSIR